MIGKTKMNRILYLLFVLVLVASMCVSCKPKKDNAESPDDNTNTVEPENPGDTTPEGGENEGGGKDDTDSDDSNLPSVDDDNLGEWT